MSVFKTITCYDIREGVICPIIEQSLKMFLDKKHFYSKINLVNIDNIYEVKDNCIFVNGELLIDYSDLFNKGIVVHLKSKSGECCLSGIIQAELAFNKIGYLCT